MQDNAERVAPLTPAQVRYLTEIVAAGVKVYNGRARTIIEALEARGLVEVDWDMRHGIKGSGYHHSWRITVRPILPDYSDHPCWGGECADPESGECGDPLHHNDGTKYLPTGEFWETSSFFPTLRNRLGKEQNDR